MFATHWMYQPPAYIGSYPLWVDESSDVRNPAPASASLLPAAHPLHLLVTLRLRIARGEQLGLVVGLASVSPAAFEILAVKSYGAVHCLNRILDDNDPRYVSTGDLILEANGRTHPAAMIHELLCSRCISLTLAKPRRADVASAVAAPLSEVGSCGEEPTVFTLGSCFRLLPSLLEAYPMKFWNQLPVTSCTVIAQRTASADSSTTTTRSIYRRRTFF